MAPNSQELASKERTLFTQVVRLYENKQYKKGLKTADQILKKKPDHGDTIAMKALIINSQGSSDEAFQLAKLALQKSMKSHVCWHVYGLLYRSNKNYEEAIKAYRFALRLEPESNQIQKDLAVLQIQMRDYTGYAETRKIILQTKTMWRQNWTALAISQHLSGHLWEAQQTLTTFEETLRQPPPRSDIENAEAVLYKNMILAEMGEIEKALEHLNTAARDNLDRAWVMEKRAEYLLLLGRNQEAEKAYERLLERNPEYRIYYEGLIKAKGIEASDMEGKKALYDKYAESNPRIDAARRIPLDFLEGAYFRQAAEIYLKRMLMKKVPSLFANIKALYADTTKKNIIEEIVIKLANEESPVTGDDIASTNSDISGYTAAVNHFLAQHYNYYRSSDLDKAFTHISKSLELEPTSVDYTMTKARIWKHRGNMAKAVETMEHARTLDTRDRHINTKAAKYQLRNNQTDAALVNLGKFTRADAVGGALADLHDMQCQWFIYEDGMAHVRRGELGLALTRFHAIYDIFEIWQEDQFDFHSFSLRKGQIRAYVDMIRWQDRLRQHPFFTRAALAAIKIYIRLYDDPSLASGGQSNGTGNEAQDASERKKAQKRARKEAERKAREEALRKDAQKTTTPEQDAETKRLKDLNNEDLIKTTEPLTVAMKFLTPILDSSPRSLEVQQTAFKVYFRRQKIILALRALLAAHALSPDDALTHYQTTFFRHHLNQHPAALDAKAQGIFNTELETLIPRQTDLKAHNDAYLQRNAQSAPRVQVALQVRAQILEKDGDQDTVCKDMIRVLALEGCSLADASRGLDFLRKWTAKEDFVRLYIDAAAQRFPHASAFIVEGK